MPLLVLLIVGCIVMIVSLKRRIEEIERRQVERFDDLDMRLRALEDARRPAPVQPPAVGVSPARASHPAIAAGPEAQAQPRHPAVVPAPAAASRGVDLSPATPMVEHAPQIDPESVPFGDAGVDAGAWEVVVGSNWLNKLGVLVFVIGVALLVGYSMTHVGPAGRVAMGYTLSLAMLAAGVVLERRPSFANYAYGLIAGGWAGTYFTTYAMHGLESARILDNDVLATIALVGVAAGMVWHSLKYRSQTVTALAYVVAYATLALTPLSGFAMLAAIPLAVSILVIAQRFGWPNVAALGVVSTYGMFALRGRIFPGDVLNNTHAAPYLALAAYWLCFEGADLFALHRHRTTGAALNTSMFALNAVGYLGAGVLQLPFDDSSLVFWFLTASAVAYLASAIVRAQLGGGLEGQAAADGPRAATAVSAALVAWAIAVRFSGARETAALLLETELLFIAGLTLGDRTIRMFAALGAAVTTAHAISLIGTNPTLPLWLSGWRYWSGPLAITAIGWYANRELLRVEGVPPEWSERLYAPAASLLVVAVLWAETAPHFGIALYGFGGVLVIAGLVVDRDYRYQGYVAGVIGALLLFRDCVLLPGFFTNAQAAPTLLGASVASYLLAVALIKVTGSRLDRTDQAYAASIAWWIGTMLLAALEWRLADEAHVAPLWALTALVQLVIGRWRQARPLRLLGYSLLLLAILRAMQPVLGQAPAPPAVMFWACVVIAALYAATLIGRPALAVKGTAADLEDALRIVTSLSASVAIATLVIQDVRPTAVTLALGLEGAILLAVGFPLRERVLRLSGLTLLLFCILKLFVHDLAQLEALARILSFVVLGLVLLAVSWSYTRFREQIRKFL